MLSAWFARGVGADFFSSNSSACSEFLVLRKASIKPSSISLEESSASTSMWWLSPPSGEAIMKKSLEGKPSSAP
ncbi:Uncharacterised protein [Vibrio cholerae]|nr:Uncharacterised protein [Vibrio cholerae]